MHQTIPFICNYRLVQICLLNSYPATVAIVSFLTGSKIPFGDNFRIESTLDIITCPIAPIGMGLISTPFQWPMVTKTMFCKLEFELVWYSIIIRHLKYNFVVILILYNVILNNGWLIEVVDITLWSFNALSAIMVLHLIGLSVFNRVGVYSFIIDNSPLRNSLYGWNGSFLSNAI